jgi:hypothetical protein
MLAAMLERWEEAERHFETALACCDRLGARAIRARGLLEYAGALQARSAAGDSGRAAALLEEARRLSEDLGLTGILRRAPAVEPVAGSGDGEARFAREGEFWTLAYAAELAADHGGHPQHLDRVVGEPRAPLSQQRPDLLRHAAHRVERGVLVSHHEPGRLADEERLPPLSTCR